ncbi:MAG TPA: pitrilysin family protein [Gemmatimonadaceae bacterium]|nr:pitrilysin family protein [Gemmatimonadaceae bacterium]
MPSSLISPQLAALATAGVHRTVLANGLTVLVSQDSSAPAAAVVTYVKAGYFDETDDVAGIAHVLEHMFFKGTPTRGVGEVARQTKASGGYLNAHTIYDHTSYYAVLPTSGFAQGLEIQADAYANSVIDADELRRELEVIIQEAKRKSDNPVAVATETMYALLHDRHRIRRWRIGHEDGLRALTRDALMAFYRNFYRPSNTILSIVGDVSPDRVLRQVETLYGSLPDGVPVRVPGPSEHPHGDFRYEELCGDVAHTQMVMGWRTPGTLHADTPLLDIAAVALGGGRASRLYRAVRERGLASSVSAYDYTPTELGVFVLHLETEPEHAAAAGRHAWDQLAAVRDEGVGHGEVERARRLFEARWLRRLESMDGQAHYLAEWEALGDWRLGDRYLERLLTATPAQVTDAVRRYVHPDRAAVVVYRPRASERVADSPRTMRGLLSGGAVEPLAPVPPRQAGPGPLAPPTPVLEREEGGVRVYRSLHGVPILVRRKPGAPIVHFGLYLRGGAIDESAPTAGITKLLTRSALKGTRARTAAQIAEDAEMLGATLGGAANGDTFGWSMSVPTLSLAAAIELLADVSQRPTIPDAAFETERQVAVSDVEALRDDMYRYPMRLAVEAAYAGHPYGVAVGGTEESLTAATAGDVRAWHEAQVLHGDGVLALVGDVDPDRAAALLCRCFGHLRPAAHAAVEPPVWPTEVRVSATPRDKAQTALVLAFPSPGRRDEHRFAAELIAGVASGLGGRFFEELRDRRSLAYTVHAHSSERVQGGMFVAYIATGPEQEDEAREALLAEFRRLREEPVTAEELDRARTYAVGTHAISRQSGAAVLGELVDAWLRGTGLGELESYEASVRAVTAEEMRAVAAESFDPSRRVEGIVRGVVRRV